MSASKRVRELADLLAACGPSDRRVLEFVRAELSSLAASLAEPDAPLRTDVASAPSPLDAETFAGLLDEAVEHLAETETALAALTSGTSGSEAIDACLRGFHSAKGAAGFLGMRSAVRVLHAAESLLVSARAVSAPPPADRVALLLRTCDAVARQMTAHPGAGGAEGPGLDALADELHRAAETAARPAAGASFDPRHIEAPHPSRPASDRPRRSVRIGTARADALAALVNELALDLRAVAHDAAVPAAGTDRLFDTVARLRTEVDALRRCSLLETVSGLRSMVAELSASLAKPIRLHAEGADIELDRAIVEALADPLRHLVRNACDHGIEPPSARRAAAKPAEGRITLRVTCREGLLTVEVSDDGRGLDRERIIDHAVAQGLVAAPASRASLPDERIGQFVLAPGFTTAARPTEVSGCGFGLDIARRRADRLGGTLEIRSDAGRGTTVSLVIPLVPGTRLATDPRDAAA